MTHPRHFISQTGMKPPPPVTTMCSLFTLQLSSLIPLVIVHLPVLVYNTMPVEEPFLVYYKLFSSFVYIIS